MEAKTCVSHVLNPFVVDMVNLGFDFIVVFLRIVLGVQAQGLHQLFLLFLRTYLRDLRSQVYYKVLLERKIDGWL
jgi:hypothetical protein